MTLALWSIEIATPPFAVRRGNRERIGADHRLAAAERRYRCRRIGVAEPQQSGCGQPLGMIAEHAAIVGIADRESGDPHLARKRNQLREPGIDRGMREAAFGIDHNQRRFRLADIRHSLAVDLPATQMLAIGRHIGEAMRGDAVGFGGSNSSGQRLRLPLRRASGQKRLHRERLDLIQCHLHAVHLHTAHWQIRHSVIIDQARTGAFPARPFARGDIGSLHIRRETRPGRCVGLDPVP